MAFFAGCNVVQPISDVGCIKIRITITNAAVDPDSGDLSFDGSYIADYFSFENGYEHLMMTKTGAAQGLDISADADDGGGEGD